MPSLVRRRWARVGLLTSLGLCVFVGSALASPRVQVSAHATPREQYAADRLRQAVAHLPGDEQILLATRMDPLLKAYDAKIPSFWPDAGEAFLLRRLGKTVVVAGNNASGVLYGTLELIDRINAAHGIPAELDFEDHPQLKLRGFAIGMQKPEITYEGAEYDYLYTPKDFPFFYDKAYWTKYLDQLTDRSGSTLSIYGVAILLLRC